MELNLADIKILSYLKTFPDKSVKTEFIVRKFGKESRVALEKLYKGGFVECDLYSDKEQFALPSYDNWLITDHGAYFLANHKLEKQLTSKQRLFNYFLGFGSGLLSGCLVQLFIRILQAG